MANSYHVTKIDGILPDSTGNVSGIKPYKKYVAILSQSGTAAPTAVVLEDTIGITAGDYSYAGVGQYVITKTGLFPQGKTVCFCQNSVDISNDVEGKLLKYPDDDYIYI